MQGRYSIRQNILLVSSPFNGTTHYIPFSFIICLLSVQDLYVFRLISVQNLCTFSFRFESILYSFHVHDQLLHVAF